jgi:transcription termination factor Rho
MIVAQPKKTGKRCLQRKSRNAIAANHHPEVYLIVLLIDERPEELPLQRSTRSNRASTFDRDHKNM